MTAGRMGVFADPVGAAFSVWQAGEHRGAQLVNEPGTFSWSELITTDIPASKAFYGAVFGWGADTHGEGPGAYTEWQVNGRSIGGMMEKPPQMPEQLGHLLVPGAAGVEIPKTRSDNSVNGPVEQIVFVSDVAIDPHRAEPARLGDTPDGHRVDAVSVDDADRGGDHVVRRDLASFAARALPNRRHAYNVAY